MMDMVGGHGNVMSHHKTIKDLEHYYKSTMGDNKDVQEFLKNVTSDKEGLALMVFFFCNLLKINIVSIFCITEFCIYSPGRELLMKIAN